MTRLWLMLVGVLIVAMLAVACGPQAVQQPVQEPAAAVAEEPTSAPEEAAMPEEEPAPAAAEEPTSAPAEEQAPAAAEEPTTAPEDATAPDASAGPITVDLDKIFPPGEGRELVLSNCTNCHVFTPIVILQMSENEWRRNSVHHREWLLGVSDEDYATLYAYVIEHFGPDDPVPELPQALLDAWTSY
jgi:hypothetical protein